MAIRETTSLFNRYPTRRVESVDPFKTYYLIMEGTNTEPSYFRLLEKNLMKMKIHNHIRLVYLERTANDVGSNSPKQLFNFLMDFMANKKIDHAVYAMIFDRDSFKNYSDPKTSYLDFIKKVKKTNVKMVVSSPCFEIWLLLHYPNAYEEIIKQQTNELFYNVRISSSYTYISKLVDTIFGFNPKSYIPNDFINHLPIAMQERYFLSTNLEELGDELGETVGDLILELQYDQRKLQ